ncbi:DUF6795 domain-containing protein [Roseateles sp. BYS78W]|uniref:DUF6795 domain-containing protein n=1 Tax=Pelomonas candidula TaxID=3299025 RepID=A0ABW7HIF2_9BURK
MNRRGLWIAIGAVVVVLGFMQGTAMAKMVLWSAMKGRVLLKGQPAAGAVLVRNYSWHWKNEKGSDRTVANAAGEFSFPAIEGRSLLGFLPHEPVIEQVMTIEYQGKSYDAWAYFKRDYNHNDETNGRPINITCRLEAELAAHGDITSICEFN